MQNSIKTEFKNRIKGNINYLNNGCHEYLLSKEKNGYTRIMIGRKRYLTHRLMFMIYKNISLSKNQMICHKCDNPTCINPKHLFLGDARINGIDCRKKGRNPWAKLTDHEVLAIKSSKNSHRHDAKKYGVCHKTIWDIKNNKRWLHV